MIIWYLYIYIYCSDLTLKPLPVKGAIIRKKYTLKRTKHTLLFFGRGGGQYKKKKTLIPYIFTHFIIIFIANYPFEKC